MLLFKKEIPIVPVATKEASCCSSDKDTVEIEKTKETNSCCSSKKRFQLFQSLRKIHVVVVTLILRKQ